MCEAELLLNSVTVEVDSNQACWQMTAHGR